ncbi:MAG: hypothetical protein M3383_01230 [Actinomycetota bacterium]|nr:hypothetical protein [Actinomycetota bacterium]
MTLEPLVDGPAWTGSGIHESGGRYPLRVEGAVSSIVGRLLPGVITTTRHARMYGVHTLAWSVAHERKLEPEPAAEFVRRCEVVIAGIHHYHEPHRVTLSSAHGESDLYRFIADDQLDVAAAAQRHGLSVAGFANVYYGLCVAIGALAPGSDPRPGERADMNALREDLGDLLELAERPSLSVDELREAKHLCLCEAAPCSDGRWLRNVLVEDVDDRPDDRHRQLTCVLLLEALRDAPSPDATSAFRNRWAFGPPEGDAESDERAMVAALWRAASLRNFSVGAWRALWRWLTAQLAVEPMTAQQLGDRFADALEDLSVSELLDGLPTRTDGPSILPAEVVLAEEEETPTRWVRQLAVGASRLDDLDGPTLAAYVGSDPTDLGPRWVAGLLGEARERHIRDVARELAVILVRRAQRVALSKMYLTTDGRPFVPTRLHDRDGILSVRGEEGAGDVALRISSLAAVLAGLGYLNHDDGTFTVAAPGEELLARLC